MMIITIFYDLNYYSLDKQIKKLKCEFCLKIAAAFKMIW